jgi:hypothetical protein
LPARADALNPVFAIDAPALFCVECLLAFWGATNVSSVEADAARDAVGRLNAGVDRPGGLSYN